MERSFLSIFKTILFVASMFSTIQAQTTFVADDMTRITNLELQIGDTIPNELWKAVLQVVNHSESKETIKLADYKDKLLVLDFWATWCVPCIKTLEELNKMQLEHATKLAVIPVTYEDADRVVGVISKENWSLTTVVSDVYLKQFFPHQIVPHQVWIKNNKLRAIVRGADATVENFNKIWQNDSFTLHTKKDILGFSTTTNLGIYAEKTKTPIQSSSIITCRIEGAPSSVGMRKVNGRLIVNYTNVNPLLMYTQVIEANTNQIMLEGDNIKISEFVDSPDSNQYCYQLIVSDTTDISKVKQRVFSDLNFHFDVRLDSQVMDRECYIISKSSAISKFENPRVINDLASVKKSDQEFSSFVSLLNFNVNWSPDQAVFVDESNYKGSVNVGPYDVLRKDIVKLNAELAPFGLMVRKELRPIKMYILRGMEERKCF